MIKVSNIIDVALDVKTTRQVKGSYSTLVYAIASLEKLKNVDYNNSILPSVIKTSAGEYKYNQKVSEDGTDEVTHVICSNLDEVESVISDAFIHANAKLFFEAGGVELLLMVPSKSSDGLITKDTFMSDIDNARKISNDFIYVLLSTKLLPSYMTFEVAREIAQETKTIKVPETIRLLMTINSNNISQIRDLNFTNVYVGLKYSTKKYDSDSYYDTAILIGAYYTKINLDGDNTIKDYCYTQEDYFVTNEANKSMSLVENVSQSLYKELIEDSEKGYFNFIDSIGNRVINFGGNYSSSEGIAISTDFGHICVENDICYATLEAIIGKQYLTEQGLTNIVGAINSQLQRYKTNGYLSQGAQYSGNDYTINYNGKSYEVIKRNTLLPTGYRIFTIPVANISAADRAAKKFPPISVVMETQSGARKVQIIGEVR